MNAQVVMKTACSSARSAENAAGFTLLEVMVAIAILAIALTALLGSQSQSMFVAGEANFSFTSTLLAREKMTEMLLDRDAGFSDSSGDFGQTHPGYYWKIQATPADFSEQAAFFGTESMLRRLDITIHTENERQSFVLSRFILVGASR